MKFVLLGIYKFVKGRAPQGARGLKLISRLVRWLVLSVAPRKGRVG